MVLEGHIKGVLATAFSPNGYQMATSSEDNTAKLWDMRKRSCLYTLPAHQSSVAHVSSSFSPHPSKAPGETSSAPAKRLGAFCREG